MVLFATVLTFASIFAWAAAPAMAALVFNVGSHNWMTDYNFTSLREVGNPVVASRLDYSYPSSQSWILRPRANLYEFVTLRRNPSDSRDYVPIGAHTDVLEGKEFNAQNAGSGTPFLPVKPEGDDSDVWAFITPNTRPVLAMTSPTAENQSLVLKSYDPYEPLQHWVIYEDPTTAAGLPTSPEQLRPATLAQASAEAKEN